MNLTMKKPKFTKSTEIADQVFLNWAETTIYLDPEGRTSLNQFFENYSEVLKATGKGYPMTKFRFSKKLNEYLGQSEFLGKFRIYVLSQKYFLGLSIKTSITF